MYIFTQHFYFVEYEYEDEYLAKIFASKEFLKLPTAEGLTDAALTLVRLQDIYNLDTSSVANGKLNGVQYR